MKPLMNASGDLPGAPGLASPALLARNAVLNLLAEGWIFLVLVVAMPRLVSLLGEASFGLFSLAWVVIGYLAFLDIGVNRAATKFVSEHLAQQDQQAVFLIVRTAVITNLALGLLGAVVIVLGAPSLVHSVFKVSGNLAGQARLTFYLVALAVPVLLVQGILRAVLTALQRFAWINTVNALATTAQWGFALLLAVKGYGVAAIVLGTILARIAATAAYAVAILRLLPGIPLARPASLGGLSKLLRFGGWVTASQLVSPLLVYLDRILIASFLSLSAVTLYTVPYEMMTRLRIIPSSLVSTLYPAFSERGTEGQKAQLQRLYEGSVRYLLLVMLPCILFLLVFGADLLSLWMGKQFAQQTSVVLQILGFGVLLNCMANIPYNALQALGRPDITGKVHLLELPFYLVICMVLIPHWGITGAALANSIRISLDALLLFWALHKYCGCSLRPLLATVLPNTLALNALLALALLGVRFSLNSPWERLTVGMVAIVAYFLPVWFVLVDQSDKPRIGEALGILSRQPARAATR